IVDAIGAFDQDLAARRLPRIDLHLRDGGCAFIRGVGRLFDTKSVDAWSDACREDDDGVADRSLLAARSNASAKPLAGAGARPVELCHLDIELGWPSSGVARALLRSSKGRKDGNGERAMKRWRDDAIRR